MKYVNVVGAGLAGVEAAYQLAKRGIQVHLYEMKPKKKTPAHQSDDFCELVCSNSLRSNQLTNAVGLLKEEMRHLDSIFMRFADLHAVPAGSALAVDRNGFSHGLTQFIRQFPNVTVIEEEVVAIPEGPTILASGPLTSEALSQDIARLIQEEYCYFYDAAAPIVTKESIDFSKAYLKSRWDKGDADYVNCPMNKEQFDAFYDALIQAETAPLHHFEKEVYFEGCMPFEVMAKRGRKTLLFGPMKPVGLWLEGREKPYAVVQLRQDNREDTLYNIVGFQTHLKWPEQKRILQMIPGLEHCEIVRYGVMHRNTFIDAPKCIEETYQFKANPDVFFAGQLSGVEGYVESAAAGLMAGINMAKYLEKKPMVTFGRQTMIGAMAHYISKSNTGHFQPMNANFGIMQLSIPYTKDTKKQAYALQSLPLIDQGIIDYEL